MQNKKFEHERNEVSNPYGMRWVIRRMSVPRAVRRHALPILKSKNRRRRDINQRREMQVLTHCGPRNRSINNANQRDGARIREIRTQKEGGELSVECRCGGCNATLSQCWNHEPEDNKTSTNEGSSKYLQPANKGIDPSVWQNEETMQEYEIKRNEVSYP